MYFATAISLENNNNNYYYYYTHLLQIISQMRVFHFNFKNINFVVQGVCQSASMGLKPAELFRCLKLSR